MSNEKNFTVKEAFDLAVKNHQNNNLQDAQSYYQKALKKDPSYAPAYSNLGLLFQNLNKLQKAKDCFEKAIKIAPNYADPHNNLGLLFQNLNELQKAKDCFEKAIKIDPNYADAHNNFGVIFQELGDNQIAMNCYEKAIAINPNHADAHNNLGVIFKDLGEYPKAKDCFKKAIKIAPNYIRAHTNLSTLYIRTLDDLEKSINLSYKTLKIFINNLKFINQSVPLFRLKHDVQQAQYLISKNYKVNGVDDFKKIGSEILDREENKEDKNNSNQIISLNKNESDALLPFYKSDYTYKPKIISGGCINPNRNWQEVEDEYFNSSNQIIYIDDFLSDGALQELREFCLVSKVWHRSYSHKYLGAFSDQGFISPIHLQIAIELKQKLPKLFGPHKIEKFWGFKYDTILGKGINIHADFAIHNLNFWITPDEYNNNKNSGGLKVYDTPAPENWTFKDYNKSSEKIYKFLKDNNAKCINIPYKFNRAVLFNSAYFHETDEIDFKDKYEGRRINNTYLFGDRNIKV